MSNSSLSNLPPNNPDIKVAPSTTATNSLRQKAIALTLFLVIAAAAAVFPLSKAIDRHLLAVSSTTELRHLCDHLLLNLIAQTEAERAYYLTRNPEYDKKFTHSTEEIDVNLGQLNSITRGNAVWQAWYQDVTINVLLRREYLKQLMSITRLLPNKVDAALKPRVEERLTTGPITKLIVNFIEQEEHLLISNYDRLRLLRSILNYIALTAIITTFVLAYFVNQQLNRDVKQLKNYQNRLGLKNALLEQRVKERTNELETATQYAEKERQRVEFLLQDASHRIGNSLATVSSLLSIQINQSNNDEVKSALIVARDHIQTIATAHRRLRLSEDMDTADTKDFFETVINDIELSLPQPKRARITIKTNIESLRISARDATTLAIIAGELVTNAVKHAFIPQEPGIIAVTLKGHDDGTLKLIVEDNGKGFPDDMANNKSLSGKGLGHLIISKLSMQFDAKPIFENKLDGGARIILELENLKLVSRGNFRLR